jgi:Na+/H+ antiporter NhaD/arsenite permease-like protein
VSFRVGPTIDRKWHVPADLVLKCRGVSDLELGAFAGPVAWGRVALGTALTVSGVLWSSAILKSVLENMPARLTVESVTQYQLYSWELAALATFLAAGLAGATTTHGL